MFREQLETVFVYIAAVFFLYDLSPITVTIVEERRSFLHFITRLCAVLGGTFALTGFLFSIFIFYSILYFGHDFHFRFSADQDC